MPSLVEFSPGEIWEAVKGKHRGLRVQVERDTGPAVKVLVLRDGGSGGRNLAKMSGRRWNIQRDVFLTHYKPAHAESEKPRVETDLNVLLAEMPVVLSEEKPHVEPASQVLEMAIETAMEKNGHHHGRARFTDPHIREKRQATMEGRVNSLTEEQRKDLKSRRLAGARVADLAREFHMDVPTMGNLLYDLGLHRRTKGHNSELIDTTPEPVTPAKTGKGMHTMAQVAIQYATLSDDDKLKIVEERVSGVPHADILRRYGILSSVAGRVYRELGFDYREARAKSSRDYKARKREEGKMLIEQEQDRAVADRKIEAALSAKAHFSAIVMVQRVVEEFVAIEADSLEDALIAARAYPGAIKVRSVSEA